MVDSIFARLKWAGTDKDHHRRFLNSVKSITVDRWIVAFVEL